MKTGLHTIDSDDEEENAQNEKKQKYKKLDLEKVKGLEADTYHDNLDEDGNMITGFNLKDEEEEGEFDSTGQFHFKKRDGKYCQFILSISIPFQIVTNG
jgi:CD2 antigen cytoplasmic tail-binding protein 2